MPKKLLEKINNLPPKPGVYIYKNSAGAVLYVGKAINLKNRVKQYFADDARLLTVRIRNMIAQIADLEYIVTDTETEALILENNFIKQLRPKYNVALRDDKNYLFIKINTQDQIPTIEYERKITDRKARYFGPYTSGLSIKDTLRLVRKIFPFCANAQVGPKPCFYYHIGKCPGVCFGKITPEEYRENYIKKIIQFLEGRQTAILKDLQAEMKNSARLRQFEKAAKTRDQIFALNRVLERQKIIYPKKIDQDVFSLYLDGAACINLFIIREGKLIRRENFILDHARNATPAEIFTEFLPKYYLDATDRPREILLPVAIPEFNRIKIVTPARGSKLDLVRLGEENAKQHLESLSDKHLLEEARLMSSLKELQRVLALPTLPGRIEAYDISNIQGTNPVGSMVVFEFGRPKKDQYRKFKIRSKDTPDDFAMMREMIQRRFRNNWPQPDLILIDGGKGQLGAAMAALKITNDKLEIPILGLAKKLEEIFLPGKKVPLRLPENSMALFLLQRVRDEAHRFAVKFHRQLRSRGQLASALDQISGIGPAKKKLLLQKYGSAAKARQASLTELAGIVGSKLAEKIKASI